MGALLGDPEVTRPGTHDRLGWRPTGRQLPCEFAPHPVELERATHVRLDSPLRT